MSRLQYIEKEQNNLLAAFRETRCCASCGRYRELKDMIRGTNICMVNAGSRRKKALVARFVILLTNRHVSSGKDVRCGFSGLDIAIEQTLYGEE